MKRQSHSKVERDSRKIYAEQLERYRNEIISSRVVLVYGTDAFQRDKCFKSILKMHFQYIKMETTVNDGMNSFLFYGDEYGRLDRINAIIETLNMFTFDLSERIVSIRYFDQMNKECMERIAQYTDNPNPHTKLLIVADKLDSKLLAFKKIVKNSFVIETKEMKYPSHLMQWLNNYLRDNSGLMMDENAKRFFINTVLPDAYTAFNEIKKLELYVSPRNRITVQDIKECTISSKVFTVFDLIDAVGFRQRQLALDISEKIIKNEDSIIMIISLLTSFFFSLWRLTVLKNKNISINELKERYMKDINPFFRDKYIQFLSNYNLKQIENAFDELYKSDIRAKLTMASDLVLVSDLVFKIVNDKKVSI
jgi:DNA polymerase III delta subunit